MNTTKEWSGSLDDRDPSNYWIDDETGERVNAETGERTRVIYECGICGGAHPWEWDGDCREDANRYADAEDYAERNGIDVLAVEVVPWEERVAADTQ